MSSSTQNNKRFIIPCIILGLGLTWLLNVLNIIPGVDWIWTSALAITGILVIAFGGFNKLTVVIGPWLLLASICSLLRQTDRLDINWEVPILTILLGLLMLLAELLKLPMPKCMAQTDQTDQTDQADQPNE